jgi:hypothetical protein
MPFYYASWLLNSEIIWCLIILPTYLKRYNKQIQVNNYSVFIMVQSVLMADILPQVFTNKSNHIS